MLLVGTNYKFIVKKCGPHITIKYFYELIFKIIKIN